MKKFAAVILIGMAAACSDGGLAPLENTAPNLALFDGSNGGNPHFFFLPPLSPTPSFSGTFTDIFEVVVEVHNLADVNDTRCAPTGAPHQVLHDVDVNPEREFYAVGWVTSKANLTTNAVYRLCVKIFDFELGFRDIRPVDDGQVPSDPELNEIFEFENGIWLPVTFRIEEGVLCTTGAIDCTETVLGPGGGQAVCDDSFCGLEIQPQAVSQEFLFVVQLVDCPVTPDGRVNFINADIPQFPGCLDITVEPAGQFPGLAIPGIAAACVDAPGLTPDQFDRLQLHHQKDDGTIEALPDAPVPFVDCTSFIAMREGESKLGMLARKLWRGVQQVTSPWFDPRGVAAIDRGLGGEGFVFGSPFVWALPSQMAQTGWTNPVEGRVGDVVNPTVLVTDVDGGPVENATVTFDVTIGNGPPAAPVPVRTNAAGLATVPWTLDPAGPLKLEASGVGIGVAAGADGSHRDNPPPGGSGVFADHSASVVDLGTGVLDFDAIACDASGAPVVDGTVGAGEYPNSAQFNANLSGGSTPATVYWTNGCDDLFLAVVVEDDAAIRNHLRIIFDNDGDGSAELGDDVLVMLRSGPNHVFEDHFLPLDCLNSSQAACSERDPGVADGAGVVQLQAGSNWTVFELSHPLRTGDGAHDVELDFGDTAGFFLAMLRGNGNQGNTEFPGFRVYQPLNIVFP